MIKRIGRCRLPDSRTHDPFTSLVRVIASQQLSGKAADTIFGRVVVLAGGGPHLDPSTVRALSADALRAAGLSRPKISYVYDLADRVIDGRLDLHAFETHSDEEVIAAITAVKGLGRWSAEMFLMFQLLRLDVWPTGDLGVRKGYALAWAVPVPTPKQLDASGEAFRPFRSVAAWYCWAALRSG